jgi:dTDP-4-amino-4,6-dideoxygalactose transaminase
MIAPDKIMPHSAVYIDMPWTTLLKTIPEFIKPTDRAVCIDIIEKSFIQRPENEKLLATISVRTSLDLYLQAMDYPKGSEIIMTCINIPDMSNIVRYHGLVVVPVTITPEKMAPCVDEIKKVITSKTKAIVISYLFGAIFKIDGILKLAKEHNFHVIEDCAECFHDTTENGHPEADLSMFSFGSIKLNTAFGGGLTIIRNNEVLYRKMRAMNDTYPILANSFFFKKILKNMFPMLALNVPFCNRWSRFAFIAVGFNYKEAVVAMLRGFPADDDFLSRFRKQMPDVMLALLAMRMKTFDVAAFEEATIRQKEGQKVLLEGGTEVPGSKADQRYFWLYPIIVPDVDLCYKLLNAKGIDAYLGATQLDLIESPVGSRYKYPQETLDFFNRILYLPIHKNVPRAAIQKICQETVDVVNVVNNIKGKLATKSKL